MDSNKVENTKNFLKKYKFAVLGVLIFLCVVIVVIASPFNFNIPPRP